MSIREKLLQIQQEGEGLANKIDQKKRLEEFKERLCQTSDEVPNGAKLKEMLVDTELLDMLAEAVDHIPMVWVILVTDPRAMYISADFTVLLQWEGKGQPYQGEDMSWKELGVAVDGGKIIVYSAYFLVPANDKSTTPSRDFYRKKTYFGADLNLEKWRDRGYLESSVADALWATGIRPKKVSYELLEEVGQVEAEI